MGCVLLFFCQDFDCERDHTIKLNNISKKKKKSNFSCPVLKFWRALFFVFTLFFTFWLDGLYNRTQRFVAGFFVFFSSYQSHIPADNQFFVDDACYIFCVDFNWKHFLRHFYLDGLILDRPISSITQNLSFLRMNELSFLFKSLKMFFFLVASVPIVLETKKYIRREFMYITYIYNLFRQIY